MAETDFQLAHSLNAVLGWLELGNPGEARAELERLPAKYADDPDVLDVRWLLHAREDDWTGALQIAERLVRLRPGSAEGWLHRAYALRRAVSNGLERAAEALLPAFEKFPREPTIPYNLACYTCQLGRLDEARQWLAAALKAGERPVLKALALADSDLEILWPEIREW